MIAAPVGFRLEYMEFLNWGTFNNKIWRLQPEGNNSLLTGSIGSGKSTIVDALTSLIVPHHRIVFNKAAGAEGKERNLLSYVKGNYSTKSEETERKGKEIKAVSLRYRHSNDATFTVILANFKNVGYNSNVSLAQVFWIENEKVQKLLIISTEPLSIREYFTNIEDPRELRKRLRDYDFIKCYDDNFSQYSQRFRHLFGMTSDKAIDLFYQTVSMKSVSSLTTFVREQMLERNDIKTQIEELKKRFDDLSTAYKAVQIARQQKEILDPLQALNKNYEENEQKLQALNLVVQAIPAFFAQEKIGLMEDEIRLLEGKLNQYNNQLAELEDQLKTKRKSENQLLSDIENNGGARLKEIANEINNSEKNKKLKRDKYSQYADLTELCGLPNANVEQTFYRNLKLAEQKLVELTERQNEILTEHGKKAGGKSEIDKRIELDAKELASLKSRGNQLPMAILNIRQELAQALDINEQDIPFAGELMRVKEEEKEWEGALERLLGGFGTSMLVPEKHYKQISEYVNSRKLIDSKNRGLRFEYFKVPASLKNSMQLQEIDADSVVNKMEIKPDTPFADWLENELQRRFNLKCVAVEDFQRQPDVITKEGQFKIGNQRHIKDDRRELWDKMNFVLGWSNKEKIAAFEMYLSKLKQKQSEIANEIAQLKTENSNNHQLQARLNQISNFKNWNELNWQDEAQIIAELQKEQKELETSNDLLKTLQQQLHLIVQEIDGLSQINRQKLQDIGVFKSDISKYSSEIKDCQAAKNSLLPEEAAAIFPNIHRLLEQENKLNIKNIDIIRNRLTARLTGKDGEKDLLNAQIRKISGEIIKVMKNFKHHFPAEAMELSEEMESRAEYLKIWRKIVKDGLPEHEARFKKMLKETTINDIAAFDSKLETHEKQIKRKIDSINGHLRLIDYNKGTYITLLADKVPDKDIRDFKNDLKACYSNVFGAEEAYTEDRFMNVQQMLNRFRSNDNKDIEWTAKVTDVRNWFVFNASERYAEDDSEREFYAGTSGKSGGQKEKLAYTILASALAYQFGLSYNESRSKSFRFVVIDEAFGRGDDESTQFGLGLFKKLDLQLLIVTPLQKIHVIENYINAVHYVSKDGDESQLQNLAVEEYKEAKMNYD